MGEKASSDDIYSNNENDIPHDHSRVRVNTYVRYDLYRSAQELAQEEGWTMTDVIRESLKKFIRSHKTKLKRRK